MPETATRYEWPELRRTAADLMQRYPELLAQVPPLSDILFVMDTETAPKSKGRSVLARVSKIPAKFEDFVYEGNKLFMLEWFKANNEHLSRNQKLVLMIHELLHFEYNQDEENPEYRLRGHDFEDFRILIETFGLNWTSRTIGDIPDVLSLDFEWGKQGQKRFNLSDHVEEIAQAAASAVPGHTVTVSAGDKEASAKTNLAGLAAEMVGTFGLEGAKAVVETIKDAWQPAEPFVKSNVVPLRSTGTNGAE